MLFSLSHYTIVYFLNSTFLKVLFHLSTQNFKVLTAHTVPADRSVHSVSSLVGADCLIPCSDSTLRSFMSLKSSAFGSGWHLDKMLSVCVPALHLGLFGYQKNRQSRLVGKEDCIYVFSLLRSLKCHHACLHVTVSELTDHILKFCYPDFFINIFNFVGHMTCTALWFCFVSLFIFIFNLLHK